MAGIQQIRIPIRANEVSIEKIEPYLPLIYNQFQQNARQIRADYDSYCLKSDILGKTRLHDDDINNIVMSPHIRAMVDWKVGYTLGNPIKYAQSKDIKTDDITTLNKYIRNSSKRTIDTNVAKWVYASGVGYYFIQPKSNDFNVNYEAPFDIYCINSDSCGKVYSSYLGNKPLFDFLYTTYEAMDEKNNGTTVSVLSIYLKDKMYEYQNVGGYSFRRTDTQERGVYNYLPLVEKKYNANGVGIVAMARYLQKAIDEISSASVDNIQDIVNEVWAFINVSLGKTNTEKTENLRAMKKLGAIELEQTTPDLPPDIKSISTKLNLTDTMGVRAILLREMYDTNGVPIASSNVSSGNITKGGGEVANGYENAYNRALDDINGFMYADNEVLERIIFICRNTPNCNINELQASEIDIKYCLNMTDNMLTKSQSYVNFIENGMPPAMALEKAKISNDPEAEGKMVEQYIIAKEERAKAIANETVVGIKESNL